MTEDSNKSSESTISEPLLDNPKEPVKSTAVVKYSVVSTPATFAQLQCNTDLNHPPSNWLSTSMESYGLQSVWSRNTGFSSFRMAHMFPDCVGKVNVISDAENIKKLLKLPYSHSMISMVVHRVENTLLLDDFDIHKYLLMKAEDEWAWLKKFFYEEIFHSLGDKEKRLFYKANSRNAIQEKNLISKFLYHSLVPAEKKEFHEEQPSLPLEDSFPVSPLLPEPPQEEELPDPQYNHKFARNVLWTFEDIQMLIGTDMPIFGGQTHPCISLKLHNATKPISVLTGIDYWLDNLMCNVPEVVMCYHLDGIVQKYELIKTEDLPNLSDAKFRPEVIKDIAQNILSFLKNNVTKAGHTYWLFKGKNDDVVKLYDLTSLCSDVLDDKSQNPFTVPVAMLLYRVARNMKYFSDYKRDRGTIRMLLKNCIQLLPKEKYPQIVTSAHYMLADLYIPADTDPSNPNFNDGTDEDAVPQSDEDEVQSQCGSNTGSERSESDASDAIKCLSLSMAFSAKKEHRQLKDKEREFEYKPPPIAGSVEERCLCALEHVSSGLECLKYFPVDPEEQHEKSTEEEERLRKEELIEEEASVNMAKPFQAIPMPYAPLKPNAAATAANDTAKPAAVNSSADNSPSHKKRNKQKKKKSVDKLTPTKSVNSSNPSNVTTEDTSAKALLCKTESQTLPTWQAPRRDDNRSWQKHLKSLLYEKASLVFVVLAENEYLNKNYGASLRNTLAVLRCQKMLEHVCGMRNDNLISYLLGRAGDCCFMTVQDWKNVEKHRNDYETKNVTENYIADAIFTMEDLDMNGVDILPENFDSLESTLVAAHRCYEKALALEPPEADKNNLLRRLGNIHNELGVLYMNQAGSLYQQGELTDTDPQSKDSNSPLVRSYQHLNAGIKTFEKVQDQTNLALLHSNTGRLMRLCAHLNSSKRQHERLYYNNAISSYREARQVLGERSNNPTIWDSVTWDLTSTMFAMASALQDYPMVATKAEEEELEREVVCIFKEALRHCDIETPGTHQPLYQFRAATIHHRLASLYHKIYRELEAENMKRKNSLLFSKQHYETAAKLLLSLEQAPEFLTVQLERVSLAKTQAENINGLSSKIKIYRNCLEIILQSRPMVEIIAERKENASHNKENENNQEKIIVNKENSTELEKNNTEKKLTEDEERLVGMLEQQLQFVLQSLTKLCLNKNSSNQKKECENTALYKECYSLALQSEKSGKPVIKRVGSVLEKIEKMIEESNKEKIKEVSKENHTK